MYSPTKAARVTGKSKNTIIKAIQSGRLAVRQQKNGRYLIAPEQLEQVYPIAGQSEPSFDAWGASLLLDVPGAPFR